MRRLNVLIAVLTLCTALVSCTETLPASDVRGEEVTYTVGEVKLTGYLTYDATQQGQRPGVLVVHEWWGHNDYVRDRAQMLAGMGYTAFALDMYGDGKQANHPGDAQKFMMEVLQDMPAAEARFRAAQKILQDHTTTDPERIAAIGYCFGGGVILHMARIGTDLDGVASFHGSLAPSAPAEPGSVKARILVLHGAADPFIPAEQLEGFRSEMDAAGADYEVIEYAGAMHGFTNPGATAMGEKFELPLAHDAVADSASWAEMETFLTEIFGE